MKNLGKRLAAAMVAASMVMGTGIAASAATKSEITVSVSNKTLTFSKNGKKLQSQDMKTSDVKLIIDEDDDLVVCYTNNLGKYKGMNLNNQRTLEISGDMNSLTLTSSLGDKVDVTVDSGSDISKMVVTNKGDVNIKGDVTNLTVNGAADVTVDDGATVSSARVTATNAKLAGKSGSNLKSVSAVKRSNVTGARRVSTLDSSSSTRDNDDDYDDDRDNDGYRVRLRFGSLHYTANSGTPDTYLRDILEDLEGEVEAYGYDDDNDSREISGRVRWSSPGKKIFDEDNPKSKDIKCSFKFIPTNSKYRTVTDSITVRIDYED